MCPRGEDVSAGGRSTIVRTHGLTPAQCEAARHLRGLCNRHDGLDLQLTLTEAGTPNADRVVQLLLYQGEELLGFLAFDLGSEPEGQGMVHPGHRRRGLGRALLDEARAVCRETGAEALTVTCDDGSESGKAFLEAVGARYRLSEYAMELDRAMVRRGQSWEENLRLCPATVGDSPLFAEIAAAAFGGSVKPLQGWIEQQMQESTCRFYLAWLGEQAIGSIRLVWLGRRIYPTTIAIRPELQGRGYGGQMLSRLVEVLVAENWDEILIEVETENRNALSLYRRCGFRETRSYGFYRVDV
jgi:ribosomal protein S18 acetylase RimI-like enzyme